MNGRDTLNIKKGAEMYSDGDSVVYLDNGYIIHKDEFNRALSNGWIQRK